MTADIITLYIQIFCIITFTLYLVYVLAVIPLYKPKPEMRSEAVQQR